MTFNRNFIAHVFKWATTGFAAFYASFFLVALILRLNGSQISSVDVDWSLPQNPRFTIALILVTATACLWVLRDVSRGVAALLFAGAIAVKVYFWWGRTNQIKANTGLGQIPQTDWIGNMLIGAGRFELVAVIATASLLAFGLMSLLMRRESEPNRQLRTLHS